MNDMNEDDDYIHKSNKITSLLNEYKLNKKRIG